MRLRVSKIKAKTEYVYKFYRDAGMAEINGFVG